MSQQNQLEAKALPGMALASMVADPVAGSPPSAY